MHPQINLLKMDIFAFVLSSLTIMGYPESTTGTQTPDLNKHLEMGRIHLEQRQFGDALTHYHAAVEIDSNNYQTYYKRALVFMALGKYNQALKDLDKVIELKSDFTTAILQRANLLLKQGKLDEAHVDYERVLRRDPDNHEALIAYQQTEETRRLHEESRYYLEINDCVTSVDILSKLIEVSPWDSELRRLRSDCYMTLGDATHAIMDLRFTTKLNHDDTEGIYRLSSIQYQLGEVEDSLREIRECLKLDPEHKFCFPLYKILKKLDKYLKDAEESVEKNEFSGCVESIKKALKVDKKLPQNVEFKLRHKLCICHQKNGEGSLASDQCNKALEIREDVEVLCDLAESHLLSDFFDEATATYRHASNLDPENKRASEGLNRVQKLQKQASKRDYYKILNVKRSASKQEIVKAYRKAAKNWHPDNFSEDNEKKAAEKKFLDIASAKEVLTDPEKRAKFDQGEDPLDPEQNSGFGGGGGGQPFSHFHFNQGPFHFKFQ